MPKAPAREPLKEVKEKKQWKLLGSGSHGETYLLPNGRVRKYVRGLSFYDLLEHPWMEKPFNWPERIRTDKKKFQALRKAGCSIPNKIRYNKKESYIEWDDIAEGGEVLTLNTGYNLMKIINEGGKKLAKRMGEELARMHQSGYYHIHNPSLSSMHVVKKSREYYPIVADLGNIRKARVFKASTMADDVERAMNVIPGQLLPDFLNAYARQIKDKGVLRHIRSNMEKLANKEDWRMTITLKKISF